MVRANSLKDERIKILWKRGDEIKIVLKLERSS